MTPPDWSVRDELNAKETGFGSNELIATQAYEALVEKAKASGVGGSFSLKKNGEVVASVTVPGRGGKG